MRRARARRRRAAPEIPSRGGVVRRRSPIRAAAASHSAASGDPSGKRPHSSSRDSPSSPRRASTCSPLSIAEWFSGWPAIGSPYPLIVYAKIAVGRSDVRVSARVSCTSTHVVAAEIADERSDGAVVGLEHPGERVAVANRERTLERLDDLLVGRREQLLVLLVRHLVDPRSQKLTAGLGERGAQLAPVLQLDHAPARAVEAALERLGADHRHDAVERLAVEVDDPDRLLQPARRRVEDRLPDVALVELGVADQRDEAAAGPAELAVVVHVALHQRTEQRRGGAEPDRPGRVVDGDRILRPARVGLQAAEVAKRAQVRLVEPARAGTRGRAARAMRAVSR